MIVFKTYLKVLNKLKIPVILYTVLLLCFGIFNFSTSDMSTNFVASKPDILVINQDEEVGITKDLVSYLEKNTQPKEIALESSAIADALFYRDIYYVVSIPKHYRQDFLDGKNPIIEVKSTGTYQASLVEMFLNRYVEVAKIYQKSGMSEEEILKNTEENLKTETTMQLTSKLDTSTLEKTAFYFNFANYSLLAGCVYVICMILATFKEKKVQKRMLVSSMDYKKMNRILLLSNCIFAFSLWLLYVIISFFLIGSAMFSLMGLFYILNSFLFTFCALTIAFLIGNLVMNKEAVNGLVNIIALGSSFLCGAFVPMELLPTSVLNFAHLLPSYWYIKTNNMLKEVEVFNFETISPLLFSMGMLLVFALGFILIMNFVVKRKQQS